MAEAIKKKAVDKMEGAIEHLRKELSGIRTGRASLALLDAIRVDYYGTPTPLRQVAALSVPESRQITIQPWETHLVPLIEKAILASDLGLTPTHDGKVLRLIHSAAGGGYPYEVLDSFALNSADKAHRQATNEAAEHDSGSIVNIGHCLITGLKHLVYCHYSALDIERAEKTFPTISLDLLGLPSCDGGQGEDEDASNNQGRKDAPNANGVKNEQLDVGEIG